MSLRQCLRASLWKQPCLSNQDGTRSSFLLFLEKSMVFQEPPICRATRVGIDPRVVCPADLFTRKRDMRTSKSPRKRHMNFRLSNVARRCPSTHPKVPAGRTWRVDARAKPIRSYSGWWWFPLVSWCHGLRRARDPLPILNQIDFQQRAQSEPIWAEPGGLPSSLGCLPAPPAMSITCADHEPTVNPRFALRRPCYGAKDLQIWTIFGAFGKRFCSLFPRSQKNDRF